MNKIKLKPLNLNHSKQKYSKLSNNLPIILSLGKETIELELNLTLEEKEKYLKNIENISIEDLIFLQYENYLWKKIKLKSTNFTLNTLIYLNKITKKKIPIEYISFSFPELNFNENFLIEMINFVTESNGIYFNESSIFNNKSSYEIKFSLFIENEHLKTFELAKKKIKKNDENLIIENNIFNNIKLESENYDFFFIHFNEILTSINDNFIFPIFDFYNFLLNLKSNFNLKIIIFFDNLKDLFNMNENYFTQTFNIINLTDVFFWEKKNFISNIQILTNNFNLDYKNCLKFFQKQFFNNFDIKLNIIINDFNNVEIFEFKNLIFQKYNFNISPFEKINHSNYLLIQDYKKILYNNNNLFISLFLAGFLEKFFKLNINNINKKYQIEIIFPCYLKAFEFIKKMFFFKLNNFDLWNLNDDFFIVNIDKNVVKNNIQIYKKKKVENNFVLDCVHKNRSSLREFLFKNYKNYNNNNNFNNNNNEKFHSFNSTKNLYKNFNNSIFNSNRKITKNNSIENVFYKNNNKKNNFLSLNNSIYKNIFKNNVNKIININVKKNNFSEYLTNNNSIFFEK